MPVSAPTTAKLDDLVARVQADSRAPSLIAAVVRDGAIAHISAAGEVPAPHRDLQYRLGSITKSLAAAVVLGLRDEGRLDLDDRLERHQPGTPLGKVRLRQLLGHASGLQREPDGDWWERHAGGSLDALLAGITAEKLVFPGYDRYHYSNLAYGVLGGVIERLTGHPWWTVVRERLLEPLGMRRTTYRATEPFAIGYVVHPVHQSLREEPRHDAGAMAPAGQLWSTVDDLAVWAAELAGAGRVLAPAVAAEMATPVVLADPDRWSHGYGLGLQLWRSGERVHIGHTGSMPGYLAVVAVHRPTRTGAVAFANTYSLTGFGIGRLGLSLVDTVLDHEPEPVTPWRPGVEPPPEIAPLCGRWWWMGRELTVWWDGHCLLLRGTAPVAATWACEPAGPDRWRVVTGDEAGELLTVLRDPDGTVAGLDLATFVHRREPMAD